MNETGHGLPRKALEGLRAGVLEAHGYGHALTLGALERAGGWGCAGLLCKARFLCAPDFLG